MSENEKSARIDVDVIENEKWEVMKKICDVIFNPGEVQ